jgi:pyruvate/2-oxoglutarate dehydrogenase complex dihydrolipoamide acyltransferase (E2) component
MSRNRQALVVEGKIQIKPVIKICATADHRTMDCYKGAQLAAELREFLTNPEDSFGLSERIPVGHDIEAAPSN